MTEYSDNSKMTETEGRLLSFLHGEMGGGTTLEEFWDLSDSLTIPSPLPSGLPGNIQDIHLTKYYASNNEWNIFTLNIIC